MNKMRLASLVVTASLCAIAGLVPAVAQQPVATDSLVTSLAPSSRPAAPALRFTHLTLDDGLSQTGISSVLQDRQGFMWFGTQDGLNRYDGHHFTVYRPIPFDTTSLIGAEIYALAEDHEGALWVSTLYGLDRRDPRTGRFQHYRYNPKGGNAPTAVANTLLADSSGVLWAGTRWAGLDRLDLHTGRFTHLHHRAGDPTSLSSDAVTALYRSADGTLWVATTNGLNRLNAPGPRWGGASTYTFERFLHTNRPDAAAYSVTKLSNNVPASPTLRPNVVTALCSDPTDPEVLWTATQAGLVRLDTRTGATRRFIPEGSPDAAVFVALAPDPHVDGIFWAATMSSGLYRFDARTERFHAYRHVKDDPSSLMGNALTHLYTDRSGLIWVVGFFTGIDRFNPVGIPFVHERHLPGNPNSLVENTVWGITEDHDGRLWISTQGGLDRLDRTTGMYTHFRHDADDPGSLSSNERFAVYVDREGVLWSGSTGTGVDRLDPSTGRFENFAHDPDDPASLTSGTVLTINEDRSGTLWIGTSRGLNRFEPDTRTFTRVPLDPDPHEQVGVLDLLEDHSGAFWVATQKGLQRLDRTAGTVTTFRYDRHDRTSISSDIVHALHEREREPGVLWIGTGDGGLTRFDTRTEQATHFTEADGLPNVCIYGILEDDRGHLWISTNNGLSDFNPEQRTFINYGRDAGLQSREFNQNALYHSPRTGEMFFGGINGFNIFQPDSFARNEHPPDVVLTRLLLNNKPVAISPSGPLRAPLWETDEIELNASHRSVTFEFKGLHYQNPAMNKTAYQLEGFDDTWIDAGDAHSATYTNLPPGRYTLRVRAANSDALWNETGTAQRIVMLPPWYQTPWAYGLYLLLALGAIYGVDAVRRRRIIARERERTRARELEQAKEIEQAYAQLQATQAQLVQKEKLASLGALTAGIAHEIKNPLNFVNNFAAVLVDLVAEIKKTYTANPDLRVAELAGVLNDLHVNATCISESGQRADGIVKGMLMHARGDSGRREAVPLNDLVGKASGQALQEFRAEHDATDVTLDHDLDATVGTVEVVPQDISRVVLNLVSNALYAVAEREATQAHVPTGYTPSVRVSTQADGSTAIIRVCDNGGGIPDSVREHIFEPFFTTKPAGEGVGLGLSLSYDIVAAHGGKLTVDVAGDLTTFTIDLPLP